MKSKNLEIESYDRGNSFLNSRVESISVIIPGLGSVCVGFRYRGGSRTNPANFVFAEAVHHPSWAVGGETKLTRQEMEQILSKNGTSVAGLLHRLCTLRANPKHK